VARLTAAIVQARVGSTRLPGKVLAPVLGRPLLAWLLDQARAASRVGRVAVATSVDPADDPIEALCRTAGVACVRGSATDVLERYARAAAALDCATVVRLTGDNPLVDPALIDAVVELRRAGGYDYAASTMPPGGTCPHGMDVEVFTREALERARGAARLPSEREHVTFHFWKNPDRFRTARLELERDLSAWRLTVDHPQDLEVVRRVIEALAPSGRPFRLERVAAWLEAHPEVARLNRDLPVHDGWAPALARDREADVVGAALSGENRPALPG
jgi:spore coat polysaccharide biosynthesis protein SpsF